MIFVPANTFTGKFILVTEGSPSLATALLSGAVAVGIGIAAGPVHAAPLPEDQIKQNCEAKGGAYWTQVAADGTQNSTFSTNDGQGLSCVSNYRNGESWGGSCNRAAPPPKHAGT